MAVAGIDAGTATVKVVLMENGSIEGLRISSSDADTNRQALSLLRGLKGHRRIKDLDDIVATGLARSTIRIARRAVTDVTACAAGAHFLYPEARSVLDVGSQGARMILVDDKGRVSDFAINNKCSSGTGSFLDVMSEIVGVPVSDLADIAACAKKRAPINATCTVFAESEVVSLVARGYRREEIVAGIHAAMVRNLMSLVRKRSLCPPLLLTGGVALNKDIVHLIEESLGMEVIVPAEPRTVVATGAAVIGGGAE